MTQFLGVATLVPDLVQQTLSSCLNGSLGAYSNGSYLSNVPSNVPSFFFTAMFLFWPGNSQKVLFGETFWDVGQYFPAKKECK